jgi:hypothetical protein
MHRGWGRLGRAFGTRVAACENMRKLPLSIAAGFFALTATSGIAHAGLPPCPASLGGYVATVTGNSVVICPTVDPNPSSPTGGCPFTLGMDRIDEATGSMVLLPLDACVPAPDARPGTTAVNCFEDECVPPGTYEYGYQASAFYGCDGTCAGPTSGEMATIVTVTSPLSGCTPSLGSDSLGSDVTGALLAPWALTDAGVVDGSALTWSGTCCDTAPPPDAGYCAWVNDEKGADHCAVQWAPCPADGGSLCAWWYADGGMTLAACPLPADAGAEGATPTHGSEEDAGFAPDAGKGPTATDDASIPKEPGDQPVGTKSSGGSCSMAQRTPGLPFGPLFVLSLLGGLWRTRRAGARKEGPAFSAR